MKKNEILRISGLAKSYGGQRVVDNISLSIDRNEFLTLLGPSGCGKTTTLRMVGGFETPDGGEIFYENRIINAIPPYQRNINTVFQNYALFPHLNVGENIAFGLRCSRKPEKEIRRKIGEMLELVNLPDFEKRSIASLSGGQQQRIAIARALVNEPGLLLLDEPLGALDLKLRQGMQNELKRIQKQVGITFIYVTHDQEEALSMSDHIAVMNGGRIQQYGTPVDIYNEPENTFVADFIGESNIIPGTMKKDYLVSLAGRDFTCVDKDFKENEEINAVIRPEDIIICSPDDNGALRGKVISTIFRGVHWEMTVETEHSTWLLHNTVQASPGDNIGLNIEPDAIHIMRKDREEQI
ncbi:ABC transporter ATP-binding protein [Spirochaeta isovalerica]|uniref:Spermidine/putrescine import ATP-binding protein PotA n=1 Tax=Spirochaeta isovalerica TaxID=150 RepID=A0A841RD95_9SPIO|nr:ABC transporter ATP-binding protein [Spirochaeta isovalerica]MBB6481361.1 spermidine/putrescine transport system ATP-binding protein [Spirochaeta isovalerica]